MTVNIPVDANRLVIQRPVAEGNVSPDHRSNDLPLETKNPASDFLALWSNLLRIQVGCHEVSILSDADNSSFEGPMILAAFSVIHLLLASVLPPSGTSPYRCRVAVPLR